METRATKRFDRFAEFFPFYLGEHANRYCRRLHFIGSTLVLACLLGWIVSGNAWFLLGMPLSGYGFAWLGHYVYEKNRPATFKYPFYSFVGDWVMYWRMLNGKITF